MRPRAKRSCARDNPLCQKLKGEGLVALNLTAYGTRLFTSLPRAALRLDKVGGMQREVLTDLGTWTCL